jgi:hypothetical protein
MDPTTATIPCIVYILLKRPIGVPEALLIATAAVALLAAREALVRRKRPRVLEVGLTFFFGGLALAAHLTDSPSGRAFSLLIGGGIATMMAGSILVGRPFTIVPGEERVRPDIVGTAQFKAAHLRYSSAWALAFAGYAASEAALYLRPVWHWNVALFLAGCGGAVVLYQWHRWGLDRKTEAAHLTIIGLLWRLGRPFRRRDSPQDR